MREDLEFIAVLALIVVLTVAGVFAFWWGGFCLLSLWAG